MGLLDFSDARFVSHFRAMHLSAGAVASDGIGAVCENVAGEVTGLTFEWQEKKAIELRSTDSRGRLSPH